MDQIVTRGGGSNRRDFSRFIDDRPKDGVFKVDRAIYNDPEILEAEYRNIFEANWVFLCHEAHVRKPGDSSPRISVVNRCSSFASPTAPWPLFECLRPSRRDACYRAHRQHHGLRLPLSRGLRFDMPAANARRCPRPRPDGRKRVSTWLTSTSRRSRGSTAIVGWCSVASPATCNPCAIISAPPQR